MKSTITMLRTISIVFFLALTLPAVSQPGVTEVIIISTNDVHGYINNFSKMAAYVKELKSGHRDVFVFNAGDLINGNPVVDEAIDKGYPIIDLMNCIPYNISCLGNHEFENGEEILQRRIEQSSSVFLSANIQVNNLSVLKPLKPYHILLTSDGTSIAVFGLNAASSNPCLVSNVTVSDPVKKALEFRFLKKDCQVLIALTHIGYKADSMLATSMKELDLIVGGHSHSEIPHGIYVNGILITQAGDKLRFVGKTVLKIKDHRVIEKKFEMIDLSKLAAVDSGVQAKIDAYNNNPLFSRVAGIATTGFNNKEAMGALKTDAIANTLKLDIAFDHVRNISYSSFPKGDITVGDIYEWDSYDYKIIRFELTAAEIRKLIINSMKKAVEPVLFVSGITYTLKENTDGVVESVLLKHNNVLLSETRHFSVGMNSFIACHFMDEAHKAGTTLSATAAETLIKYLKHHKKVNYSIVKRVFIEPSVTSR